MKKLLLVTVVALLSLTGARASHMMGGQITVQHLSALDYIIKYTGYRDITGIPIATIAIINFIDSSSGNTFTASITYDPANVITLVPGVQQYEYVDTVTFPAAGNWYASYEECCRNCAILNMSNPCFESHHFYTHVLIDSLNSTPYFLNPPIVIAQQNTPFYYNPLPFDADGDSIAWQLDVPLSMAGMPVAGYSLPPSDTLVPFNMDPITGDITFLPNTLGNFQVSVRVMEYRNGVQIGEISRDMQIIVVPSGNSPALITVSSNQFPFGGKTYTIAPGAAFSMTMSVIDPDNQTLACTGAGEPFLLANNPAMLSVSNAASSLSAVISWTPDASQQREKPYIIGLRVAEPFAPFIFQSDISFNLKVGVSTTGLGENNASSGFVLMPNPTRGDFALRFESASASPITINVNGLDGKRVAAFMQQTVNTGLNQIQINKPGLSKGFYMVELIQDNRSIGIQKLIVE